MVGLNGSPRRPRRVLLSFVVQPFGWRLSWRWIGPRCYVVAFLSGHNVLAANVFRKRCVSAVYSLVSVSHRTHHHQRLSFTSPENQHAEQQQEEADPAEEDHPTFSNSTPMIVQDCKLLPRLFWWPVFRLWGLWCCFIFGESSVFKRCGVDLSVGEGMVR